jgi:hypothetical protein
MLAMAAFMTIPSAFDLLHTGDIMAGTTLLQPGHDGAQSDKEKACGKAPQTLFAIATGLLGCSFHF